jgi:formylglycine-generating enzyme required for sulfatase activity
VQRAAAAEQQLIAAVKSAKPDGVVNFEDAQEIQWLAKVCLSVHPGNGAAQRVVQQTADIIQRHLQQWTAGNVRAEEIRSLTPLRNSIGMELRLLPAGRFEMSSNRKVRISRPFYIGVYQVTNSQWKAVMGDVPSKWEGADLPVESVSWEDVTMFCRRLSARPEEKRLGREYRFPTEAEWEYACRAGTTTEYSFGDDESILNVHAWFDANSGGQTHPVGQKRPNAWGLYDMHGNVWEWCDDWFEELSNGGFTDPKGPRSGSHRVLRGGSWRGTAWSCRSARRSGDYPSSRDSGSGFRLALSPSGASSPEAGE